MGLQFQGQCFLQILVFSGSVWTLQGFGRFNAGFVLGFGLLKGLFLFWVFRGLMFGVFRGLMFGARVSFSLGF